MQDNILKQAAHLGAALPKKPLSGEVILKLSEKNIRNKLIDELFEHLSQAQILYSSIETLQKIKSKKVLTTYNPALNNNDEEINNKIKEIIDFLIKHSSLVGKEQAIIDLQRGLTILNKNNRHSCIASKRPLLNDGIYGDKTYACLCNVCRHYDANTIKNYIKKRDDYKHRF